MLVIDLIVGAVILAAAIYGVVVGLGRALPVAGFAAGVVLGSRLPLLLGEELDSHLALLIALPAALIAGGIIGALAERLAPSGERLGGRSSLVDGVGGALLVGASAAVVAWAVAPAVSEVRSVRDEVQRSEVLERFNAVLTPAGSLRPKAAPTPDLPRSARRRPEVAGEPRLLSNPAVRRADRSLVEIVTARCRHGYQGTGWIAGRGFVVTNAHVVSAARRVTVMRGGLGSPLPATVVWFDGIHDLALLRVARLRGAPGLRMATDPRPQTPGFTLGFPSGRKTIRSARLGATTSELSLPTMNLGNNAGVSLTMKERLVTVIRGLNGPGGSGGPMIDRHGRVLATVFAGISQHSITLGVPNRIVRSAMRRARGRVGVPACGDPPLKPTPKESIAARNA
ncbi:MAG: trypsin-like peptidase domain-containing protein [Solirubrobacterales bacterium]|nr:trypsin-like peptidase domain-containing protein [Solirubrobacterales bacterium]